MADSDDDSTSVLDCHWDWPVWCIVLMALAGVLLIAGIVLTGLNGRMYRQMQSAHGAYNPSRHAYSTRAKTRSLTDPAKGGSAAARR